VAKFVVVHGFRFDLDSRLSPGYAAELAGVTPGYLKDQGIPSVRNGRNDRQYLVADVLAWCADRDARVEARDAARRKTAAS
jgi:hypothetical protein